MHQHPFCPGAAPSHPTPLIRDNMVPLIFCEPGQDPRGPKLSRNFNRQPKHSMDTFSPNLIIKYYTRLFNITLSTMLRRCHFRSNWLRGREINYDTCLSQTRSGAKGALCQRLEILQSRHNFLISRWHPLLNLVESMKFMARRGLCCFDRGFNNWKSVIPRKINS